MAAVRGRRRGQYLRASSCGSGVADQGHVHDAERQAVGEVVDPAKHVNGEGELGIGLVGGIWDAKDHGAKAGEDLEEGEAEPVRADMIDGADDLRKPEDVVCAGRRGSRRSRRSARLARAGHHHWPESSSAPGDQARWWRG